MYFVFTSGILALSFVDKAKWQNIAGSEKFFNCNLSKICTYTLKFFSGSNRTVIVDTNLEAPMGLALDLKRHRLFWCDSALTTLNSVNFDGADRHSLMESESRKWLSKPMGVTFFEGHLYWIDVTFNGGSISKVSTIQTDRAPELLADHLTDIYDLKIYSSRAQKGKL